MVSAQTRFKNIDSRRKQHVGRPPGQTAPLALYLYIQDTARQARYQNGFPPLLFQHSTATLKYIFTTIQHTN